jgi:hypothetical protein
MVAPVQVAVGDREQVTDLAVRVVDDGVEDRHLAQAHVVIAPGQGDKVHLLVQVDPQLAHARPERPVAHHRRRHYVPAGGAGDHVRGYLAIGQGPGREVPQRPLARDRLVDTGGLGPAAADGAKERRVGGVDQAAGDLQRAALEKFKRGPLAVGEIGFPGACPLSHAIRSRSR